jgi:hypothetical protein
MPRHLLLIATISALLVACARDQPAATDPVSVQPATAAPVPVAETEAEADALAPESPVAADAELPFECKNLIASYERCIEDHMPEAGRDLLREALAKSREQWQQAANDATTEATRRQLAQACQQSKTSLQGQMSGYGCIL